MTIVLDENNLHKSFGLPEGIDPNHEYVYRSGEHGIYDFWYKDNFNNYWQYTNAPKDHKDYDPYGGEAMLVADQPMQHTAPQFYTPDGRKLSSAVPQGVELTINEAYDPLNPRSVWYAMYQSEDGESTRFLYFDSDVRENLDLWVQYQLRLVDALLVRYRAYASHLFESPHPKDKIIGVMLMLVDQGVYEAHELTQMKVEDVEYIDMTIKLGSRKIVCDPALLDFFTSITVDRDPNEPLFVLDTRLGRTPIGVRHFYSIFKALKFSSHFMIYWHASHLYSRIVHRLAAQKVPVEDVEQVALNELSRALGTIDDTEFLVDVRLKETLLSNYEPTPDEAPQEEEEASLDMGKSLSPATQDDFGVFVIFSDLKAKRPDEFEFSQWLHSSPMHDMSDEELAAVEEQNAMEKEALDAQENAPNEAGEAAALGPEQPGTGGGAG